MDQRMYFRSYADDDAAGAWSLFPHWYDFAVVGLIAAIGAGVAKWRGGDVVTGAVVAVVAGSLPYPFQASAPKATGGP